jgi:PAS domain S-box-containing protein
VAASVPGAFALGRAAPWSEAEREGGARLAALFSTLWAWSEAEARFERAVADLDDALFTATYGPDGRRSYASVTAQAEALTGLDPDAVLAGDADWARLVVGEDREAFRAHDARLRAGEPSRVDVRLRLDGGEVVWVCERATPGVDAAGRPGASGLLADVTAQKEAEAHLDRARRVAERAAGARMAFLRTMSHELRTPLGAIRGFASLLAEEVEALEAAPPEIPEFAGAIRDAAGKALRLVDDLLDLSRLETDALDLQSVPLELGAVVRSVVARYAPDLEGRGVAVRVDAPVSPALVVGDPARVEQVVDQVVSNAARFTSEGAVTVRLAEDGGAVRLDVEDTGVGIAADVLDAVFEPFVQEDDRVNRAFGGTGLGLAIASRLAAQMGGRLDAQSAKGVGSTFTLSLPRA